MNVYSIYVLMGQRVNRYEGEHAPEALECMDEFAYDENGEWLHDKKKEYDATGEFTSTVIINVEIPFDPMEQALKSTIPKIDSLKVTKL